MRIFTIKHAIITPVCRENKGADGAFEEAVERMREQYNRTSSRYPSAVLHLKLELDRESIQVEDK